MRTVIISHNNNPIYSFFEPIVKWAWSKFGWDCKCIVANSPIESQVIRLYAGFGYTDELLMTSDIDMLPLSDYWNPDAHKITCYGRDLSDRHYPICYIAMNARKWQQVMISYDTMQHNIQKYGNYWLTDQDMITDKLNHYDVVSIDRGTNPMTGYPLGRVDRSAWDISSKQALKIDAHLLRPGYTDENWPKIMRLIKECLNPTPEEINWLETYRTKWIESHS